MTNSFSIDLVGNDKASGAVGKVQKSLVGLIGTLNSATSAYEKLIEAQGRLGVKAGSSAVTVNIKNVTQALGQQATAHRTTQAAAERAEAAIENALRGEARARAQVVLGLEKATAVSNLARAKTISDSQAKQAALAAEADRIKALIAAYKEQRAAAVNTRTQAKGNAASNPDDVRAAQAYKIATQEVKLAQDRLRSTTSDLRTVTTAQTQAATAAATAARQQATATDAAAAAAQRAAAKQTAALNTTRYALYQVSAAYAAVAHASGTALKEVLTTSIGFQSAFAQVARTTGLGAIARGIGVDAEEASTQLAVLRSGIVDLSRDIGISFQDLTGIGALGAQLGIAAGDVREFTEVTAKFAATTNVTTEAAATYFGRLQNILDVPTTKFRNLASAVSELGVRSVATESEILAVTTQIGAMANNAGFSAEYVLGLGTALSSLRVAPELARGTTTRVFQNITRAAADGGDKIAAFGRILGVSGQEAKELWESNPNQFFTDFITGLGRANDAGQNLTPLLDSIGIKGARDVPVITRLANSYELLAEYTDRARTSFADGGFLDESFQTVQETAQNALNRLGASFEAFKDTAGQAFLPVVTALANGFNIAFKALSALPSGISAFIIGITAAIGVMYAFRAVSALAGAGILAMASATQGLGVTQLRVGTIITAVNARLREQAATAGVAAGATRSLAAADTALIPAATGAAAANTALGFSFKTLFASIGPAGWLILGVGLLAGGLVQLTDGHNSAAEAAERDAQAQKSLNQEWYNAGEGADALRKAIAADTQAYKDAGNQANEANGVFRTWSSTVKDLGNGMEQTVTVIKNANGEIVDTIEGTERYTDRSAELQKAVEGVTGAQSGAVDKQKEVKKAVDEVTVAIGNQTAEWEKAAINEQINKAFDTEEMQNTLVGLLEQFDPETIKAAFATIPTQGSAGIAAALGIDDLNAKLALTQEKMSAIAEAAGPDTDIADILGDTDYAALEAQYASYEKQIAAIDKIVKTADDAKTAIDAIGTGNVFQNAVKEALDLSDAMEEPVETGKELIDVLQSAADAFSALYASATGDGDFQSEMAENVDALGESLVENGTKFSRYTDEGRSNFAALDKVVKTFVDNQAAQIAAGTTNAAQAASNTAGFIEDLMKQLSDQDVDVSELDYLADYAAALTANPYTMAFDADTSVAIAAMTDLAEYAQVVNAFVSGLTQGASNTGGASNNPGPAVIDGKVVYGPNKGVPKSSAPTPLPPPQRTAAFIDPLLGGAVAAAKYEKAVEEAEQANKDNEKSAKDAGDAAKDAAEAAADAEELAAEKVKKHQEYLDDLADSYKDFATQAFSGVSAEGGVFEALQKLGIALDENGVKFDTMTQNGRDNFAALISVFDSFGATLESRIEAGTLTAEQASDEYKQFAQGVYGELVRLGVPTQAIDGFFKELGVSAGKWTGTADSVSQYAGFITTAKNATVELADATQRALDITQAYGDALQKAFDRKFGVASAADETQAAINGLRDAYQESIDKVKELRRENQSLSGDLAVKLADKRKAEMEQAISKKYGETDRAASYGAQAKQAGGEAREIQARITTNKKEVTQIEKGRNALKGNSKEALNNRKSLRDLQRQMLDQITTYAETGASTDEVAKYTVKMKDKFIEAAREAGYTTDDIRIYTDAFDDYVQTVKDVPATVTTTAVAKTQDATVKLNKVPHGSRTLTTTAVVKIPETTRKAIRSIPDGKNYVVKPKMDQKARESVQRSLSGIGGGRTVDVKPKLTGNAFDVIKDFFVGTKVEIKAVGPADNLPKGGKYGAGGGATGGRIKGYKAGGRVGGPSPVNPRVDNLVATGPNGEQIGLQGGEGILNLRAMATPGVPEFMDIVNGQAKGYSPRQARQQAAAAQSGPMLVELSPKDRQLLANAGKQPVSLYADRVKIADSTSRGNARLASRGRG